MYTITALCRLAGTKPSTLRTWERRYGVPRPARSERGRRLYDAAEANRVSLLVRLVDAGHPIGDIASRSLQELEDSLAGLRTADPGRGDLTLQERLITAVLRRDFEAFRMQLSQALILLPPVEAASEVVAPVLREVGRAWREGAISIAVEHLVSAITRQALLVAVNPMSWPRRNRTVLFTTPPGERHEIGALLAWYVAGPTGWNTIYLGPDTPFEECAEAAITCKADVIALSVVGESDRTPMLKAAGDLSREIAPCKVWIGAPPDDVLHGLKTPDGVTCFRSLREFQNALISESST